MSEKDYDVVIIGGGPAGLTAGLYTSRAKLDTLLIDRITSYNVCYTKLLRQID